MEELKGYLKNNLEELKNLIVEINDWNGQLDWLDYWENDEDFLQTFYNGRLDELARAIFYGNYNYMDEYIIINAYGNIETLNQWEYEQEIKDSIEEVIDAAIENIDDLQLYNKELEKLIKKAKEEAEE